MKQIKKGAHYSLTAAITWWKVTNEILVISIIYIHFTSRSILHNSCMKLVGPKSMLGSKHFVPVTLIYTTKYLM